MIRINNGSLAYGNKAILSDINLNIKKGEFVVVCGESGSGKSSLIRVLNGLIPELYKGKITGNFTSLNQQLPTSDFNAYVKDIGVVFQNPKTQFFMNDVYSELAFSMENCGESRDVMKNQIKKISKQLNISSFWQKNLHDLSGGEKQRVAFSSACIMPRKLFLLDEPSSNLDDKNIEQIKQYLSWLKKQNHTIVVAEHRLYYLVPLVDRFILLKDGHVDKEFTKLDLLKMDESEIKELGLRSLTFPKISLLNYSKKSSSKINTLTCQNIRFSYDKNMEGVSIKDAKFTSNDVTAIVGGNGVGKTTFSSLLTGILKPESGDIYFNGIKQSRKQLIKKSFYVMQDVNLQLFFESVDKEITANAKRLSIKDMVIETLDLGCLLDKHPQTLSGGQKQRVAIATAILSGKDIIVMDEPTSGLDLKHMYEVSEMVKKIKSLGIIMIIISHDKEFINLCCEDIIELPESAVVDPD